MALRLLNDHRRPTKLAWVGGGVVALLAIGGVASAVQGESAPQPSVAAAPFATTTTQAAKPNAPETSPATDEAPVAAQEPLAPRVEAALKATWGVSNFTDGLAGEDGHDPTLLNWTIASMEDQSPGIVHVTVQVTGDETSKPEVEQLAKNIMRLSQDEFPDLTWVVVQTADGKVLQQSTRLTTAQ